MRKNILFILAFTSIIFIFGGCTSQNKITAADKTTGITLLCVDNGEGTGKTLSQLKVNVTYFDPYFYTEDGYPGYYIGVPLTCKLTIENPSTMDFNNITVSATHEYYETGVCDRWWYPYPREANYTKGEALPGKPDGQWTINLHAKSHASFTWTYTSPIETCSGLDQTHVIITKDACCGVEVETVILDSPEAGIFCPPPPEKN